MIKKSFILLSNELTRNYYRFNLFILSCQCRFFFAIHLSLFSYDVVHIKACSLTDDNEIKAMRESIGRELSDPLVFHSIKVSFVREIIK